MGLDQYCYTAPSPNCDFNKHEELAYWRKHNRLHGWMELLWETRKKEAKERMSEEDRFIEALDKVEYESDVFNGVELELDELDIDSLENDIEEGLLPKTSGFFFGNDSYESYEIGYKNTDLQFIEDARKALKEGKRIFYNSSW